MRIIDWRFVARLMSFAALVDAQAPASPPVPTAERSGNPLCRCGQTHMPTGTSASFLLGPNNWWIETCTQPAGLAGRTACSWFPNLGQAKCVEPRR
jgi:hypothetical protein